MMTGVCGWRDSSGDMRMVTLNKSDGNTFIVQSPILDTLVLLVRLNYHQKLLVVIAGQKGLVLLVCGDVCRRVVVVDK